MDATLFQFRQINLSRLFEVYCISLFAFPVEPIQCGTKKLKVLVSRRQLERATGLCTSGDNTL